MRVINPHRSTAFTLIEMAVVLVIVSMLVAGGLTLLARDLERQKTEITQERLLVITQALDAFAQAFQYIPCPSGTDLPLSDAESGVGTGTNDTVLACSGSGVTNIILFGQNIASAGSVPFIELGISPVYLLDGWNRRFTYIVTDALTESASYTTGTGLIQLVDADDNSLIGEPATVLFDSLAAWPPDPTTEFNINTQSAAIVIISHGKNGHGGVRPKGTGTINLTIGTDAGTHEDDNALTVGMNGTFRVRPYNLGNLDMNDYFDDFVMYRTKWQLEQRPE